MEKLNSRAGYYRERRKHRKHFAAEVDVDKLERLETKLKAQNKSKVQWLNEKIEEELKE